MAFLGGHVIRAFALVFLVGLVQAKILETVDFPKDETMVETETSIMVIDSLKNILGWWNSTAGKCYFTSTEGEKLPKSDEAGSAVLEGWLAEMANDAEPSDMASVAEKQGEDVPEGEPDSPYHALETLCKDEDVFWIEDMPPFPHEKKISKKYYHYSSTTTTTTVRYIGSYWRNCYSGHIHYPYYAVLRFRK